MDENDESEIENETVNTAAGTGRGVDTAKIPPSIAHLVAANAQFAVLLCVKPQCRRAQTVKGIEEHLRSFHHEKPAIRREVGHFGQSLARRDARFLRDYKVVQLPVDGLVPQPIVPVVNGFSCHNCRFLTVSRCLVRKHANKEHSKRRKEDD